MNLTLILVLAAFAGTGLACWLIYRKGRKDEQKNELAKSAEALAVSRQKQEKREGDHEKRVETIMSGNMSLADVSRRLSTYPLENSATHAAIKKNS